MLEQRDLEMIGAVVLNAMEPLKKDIMELKELKNDVLMLHKKVDRLEEKVDNLEEKVDRLDSRVVNLEIRIIAEGYMDLNRKLDEALKLSQTQERVLIRVGILENDVEKLKRQYTQMMN